jgi:hypothetical protein
MWEAAMSDSKGGGIPWASMGILAAFVGSTLLVPHPFDQLRPPEKERAQITLNAELEVDARLWEDPFAAMRRYEAERADRCERVGKAGNRSGDESGPQAFAGCNAGAAGVRSPASLPAKLNTDGQGGLAESLVIVALVPGNPFVGAEEGRRRTRYAVLAGLQAQGYVPDNAERIGLLEFDLADLTLPKPPNKAAQGRLVVPFEVLSGHRKQSADSPPKDWRFEQVALLWVDESALPAPKLTALARLLEVSLGAGPQQQRDKKMCFAGDDSRPSLAVIGPSSTDALRLALKDLRSDSVTLARFGNLDVAGPPVVKVPGQDPLAPYCDCVIDPSTQGCTKLTALQSATEGYRMLARAYFYSAGSTAPDSFLDELKQQNLESFLTESFKKMLGERALDQARFERTIGTDDALIERLVGELVLRIPKTHPRRLVLVAERDSLYSQALVEVLQAQVKQAAPHLAVEVVYFFRGLDGVTTRDAGRDSADKSSAKSGSGAGYDSSGAGQARLEWPESRDQLDYLRRLAQSLKESEGDLGSGGKGLANGNAIGAIGILGNDVHDKLLVLQALHDTFSDKVFFTTDMDARYLHPRVRAFTRNLIVASSLPLEFYAPQVAGQLNLQAGTPPLRDVYQTATYLAARRAGCTGSECANAERTVADLALKNPSLYEIGRNGAVPLSGYALQMRPARSAAPRALVACLFAGLMLGGLLVWPSTPALRQARSAYLKLPQPADAQPLRLPAVVLAALHAALCAFILGSLIEFVSPEQISLVQALLLAALAAFGMLLAVLPTVPAATAPGLAARPVGPPGVNRLHAGILLLVLAAWVWLAWPGAARPACVDCEPVTWLEGVSAWPSHLIHLLALLLLLCTLDYTWSESRRLQHRDSAWLSLPEPPAVLIARTRVRRMLRDWFTQISILTWRRKPSGSTDFLTLWNEYCTRGQSRPRVARTFFWYFVTLVAVNLLFFGFSDGQKSAVPVRGVAHRELIAMTLYANLLLLPLLVVAVADATMLAYRFISHLNAGRTGYPKETLEHFAEAFGSAQSALWLRRFQALPANRQGISVLPAVHSLLDDWLDVQVVARRTRYVSRLVIGPFLVLTLLVVARSRLFDNWALTPAIALAVSAYLLWLIVLAALLKLAGEATRSRALASMNADLCWLVGGPADTLVLVEPFKRLIASVQANQTGAFAPLFEQPLLKALLVPLGGAGGAQLFEYLLMAR